MVLELLYFAEFFGIEQVLVFEGHLVALLSHLHKVEQPQRRCLPVLILTELQWNDLLG